MPVGLGFEAKGEDDTRVARSVRSEGDRLGKVDGTRSVSLGRVHHPHFETQEEKQPDSCQVLGLDRGSGPDLDSSRDLGGPLGWISGLGLDYRVALCPVSTNRPLLNGSNLSEPSCFKAQDVGLEKGLRQGLPSWSVITRDRISPISSSPNTGYKGNVLHIGEEDELSDVAVQEDGRDHMNRYGDNPYVQATPIPFSVFGRPLLSGGFSGPGGSLADKDLEPLRVVAADGREWGL